MLAVEEVEDLVVAVVVVVEVEVDRSRNLEVEEHNIVVVEVQRHPMDRREDFADSRIVEDEEVVVDHYSNHLEDHHSHN